MHVPVNIARGNSRGLLLRTGDHCTETGWWSPVKSGAARFVTQGSLMPSIKGQPVLWEISEAAGCGASCAAYRCPRPQHQGNS